VGRGLERTTTVRSHSSSTYRIVLTEAALLDELLRHDIASGEEDLCTIKHQSMFCKFFALALLQTCVYCAIKSFDKGVRRGIAWPAVLRRYAYTSSNRLRQQRRCLKLCLVPAISISMALSHVAASTPTRTRIALTNGTPWFLL
jgi:hypothetical protein